MCQLSVFQTNYYICNSPVSANLVITNMNILLAQARDCLVYPDFWPWKMMVISLAQIKHFHKKKNNYCINTIITKNCSHSHKLVTYFLIIPQSKKIRIWNSYKNPLLSNILKGRERECSISPGQWFSIFFISWHT